MPGRHQLTELQLVIMRIIWDKGEATVQDIWEALHAERGLAQTTVATMLSRLERRGVVTRRAPPQSRQYHYRAAVTEQDVQHSMIGELTERLFDGDVTALVQHLLSGEDVSPGDIAKIRAMIARVETNAPESQ
jgi:predicted transcriptional regulator